MRFASFTKHLCSFPLLIAEGQVISQFLKTFLYHMTAICRLQNLPSAVYKKMYNCCVKDIGLKISWRGAQPFSRSPWGRGIPSQWGRVSVTISQSLCGLIPVHSFPFQSLYGLPAPMLYACVCLIPPPCCHLLVNYVSHITSCASRSICRAALQLTLCGSEELPTLVLIIALPLRAVFLPLNSIFNWKYSHQSYLGLW